MAQGIMALHPSNILTSALKRPAKVQLHKILQGTGATLALTGIVLQYLNKNWYLKIDHLGTPHSVFGRNKKMTLNSISFLIQEYFRCHFCYFLNIIGYFRNIAYIQL